MRGFFLFSSFLVWLRLATGYGHLFYLWFFFLDISDSIDPYFDAIS